MVRKITYFLSVLAMTVTLSCSDSNPILPDAKPDVFAPPFSIDVKARLEYCITSSPTVEVYHRINGGGWLFVGYVSLTTSCTSIGSISASSGDVVEFYVIDQNSGDWYSYRGRSGASCPNTSFSGYCGGPTGNGSYFSANISSGTSVISLQLNVSYTYPYCGILSAC